MSRASEEYRHHNEHSRDDLLLALRLFRCGVGYKEIGEVVGRADKTGSMSPRSAERLVRRAIHYLGYPTHASTMEEARLELRFAFEVIPAVERALKKEYESELNETIHEIKYITTNRTPPR